LVLDDGFVLGLPRCVQKKTLEMQLIALHVLAQGLGLLSTASLSHNAQDFPQHFWIFVSKCSHGSLSPR